MNIFAIWDTTPGRVACVSRIEETSWTFRGRFEKPVIDMWGTPEKVVNVGTLSVDIPQNGTLHFILSIILLPHDYDTIPKSFHNANKFLVRITETHTEMQKITVVPQMIFTRESLPFCCCEIISIYK
jgi:hypothetical protein